MFSVALVGKDALVARLDAMPAAVRASLLKVVHGLAIDVQAHIVGRKLDGQVLAHRSGQLAGSIQQVVSETSEGVTGKVYSAGNVKYAGYWEFGYHGTQTVREHTRHVVFGKDVAPFTVPSFTRRVDQAPRSFMRSTLAEDRGMIEKRLYGAVMDGVKQTLADRA